MNKENPFYNVFSFEDAKSKNTLGLSYQDVDKIRVADVNLFGVKRDEVKLWNEQTALITFFNEKEQPVAEIYFFQHEEAVVLSSGTIRIQKSN